MQEAADLPKDEESGSRKLSLGTPPSKSRPGSRPGSLRNSPSMGKPPLRSAHTSLNSKYSSIPGIDREALRAGLAKQVLETAEGRVNGSAEADGTHHGLERQTLDGGGQRRSLRAASLETVQRYLMLELASSNPAAVTSNVTNKAAQ